MKKLILATCIASTSLMSMAAFADAKTENEMWAKGGATVSQAQYPSVETARQFLKQQDIAGVNKFNHKRFLTPTDEQEVVRMNRDTYYSFSTVDVSKGATVTLPEIKEGMYMSMEVITEDHRIQAMQYGAGTYELNTHTGDHVQVLIRLDARYSVEEAWEIRNKIRVDAKSANPYVYKGPAYDHAAFEATEKALKGQIFDIIASDGSNALSGMFTSPDDASDELFVQNKYEVGSAVGWGGAQLKDNIYEISKNMDNSKCYQATFEDPKNLAFTSVTVYNGAGFMFNDHANISTDTADYNADGTLTLSFGCGADAPNNITTTEGNDTGKFNLAMRHYIPSKKVMDGYRLLPLVKEVK
ncbi:hypothetical protein A9264_15005 [Vibrio sp. UCD-FRSSP16_10]|uniref:DUF1254 domain-containing protein n=1 Tax=unclassified Vibrio TaxID=2614977 RepID=UPI00080230ED|nr:MULTISPECIES: DUF1254 domain-containing protein [unclassified Vibrio]OBT13090.1 hypothetical protein A9260_15165 [Vibrio sp. UCD-FRSSP16_30]OBT19299.1 hypothetical protein A9264_15005 [Vibrio sp. UCD-FRSSP16_10]